jgi:hypothetical protein
MDPKKIFALAVGIGSYLELPALRCPPNDAKDFASVLHSGVTPSEIKLLTDGDATRESIMKQLAWLAASARSSDLAILFFSGHGGRQSATDARTFLCPVESSAIDPLKTCLTSHELTKALRPIKSECLGVFLDTCYSGGLGDIQPCSTEPPVIDASALVEGKSRMILAASRPDEQALESSTMRNGIFTTYLLEALRGEVAKSDGRVWTTDVFSFVAHRLRQHHSQSAYQKTVGENFVIMVHDHHKSLDVPIITSETTDQRTLRIAMRSVYDRSEIALLCRDIGLNIENLPGRTLENQLMDLIDHCFRHGLRDRLLEFLHSDRPQLFADG